MSNEHENDDEIRESIPSVPLLYWDGVYCLPSGYGIRHGTNGGVYLHGRKLEGVAGEAGAWDHAVAREKARRKREGQAKALGCDMYSVAELKNASASGIDIRDAALARAFSERGTAIMERDALREKLERVRGLPRFVTGIGRAMWVEDDGDYVAWSDLAAIIGKDGE